MTTCAQFSKFLKCRAWCQWLCVQAQSWLDEKLTWTGKMVTTMLVTKRTTHKSFTRDLKTRLPWIVFVVFNIYFPFFKQALWLLSTCNRGELKNVLQHKHNNNSLQYCTASYCSHGILVTAHSQSAGLRSSVQDFYPPLHCWVLKNRLTIAVTSVWRRFTKQLHIQSSEMTSALTSISCSGTDDGLEILTLSVAGSIVVFCNLVWFSPHTFK